MAHEKILKARDRVAAMLPDLLETLHEKSMVSVVTSIEEQEERFRRNLILHEDLRRQVVIFIQAAELTTAESRSLAGMLLYATEAEYEAGHRTFFAGGRDGQT